MPEILYKDNTTQIIIQMTNTMHGEEFVYQLVINDDSSFEYRYGDTNFENDFTFYVPKYSYGDGEGNETGIIGPTYPSLSFGSIADNNIFDSRIYSFNSSNNFEPTMSFNNITTLNYDDYIREY